MDLFHRITDWITGSYTDSLATQKALHCRDHVLALVARPPIYMNADQLCGYIRARACIVVRETFSGHIPLFVNQSRLLEKTIEKSNNLRVFSLTQMSIMASTFCY